MSNDLYVAERKKLIDRVQHAPPEEALRIWSSRPDDWAVDLIFATRTDLTPEMYARLYNREWYTDVALCNNRAFPEDLLKSLAKVGDQGVPSRHHDLSEKKASGESAYDPACIKFIAREALRMREREREEAARCAAA